MFAPSGPQTAPGVVQSLPGLEPGTWQTVALPGARRPHERPAGQVAPDVQAVRQTPGPLEELQRSEPAQPAPELQAARQRP